MTLGLRHMAKTTGRLRKEGPLGPWCSSPPRPEPAAGQGWHFHLGPPGEPGDSQTRFWNLQPTRENSEETPDSAEAQILPPRRNHHQPPHAGAPFSHLPPQETGVDFPAPKPGLYVPVGSARGPQSSKTLPSYHPQGPGSATARRPGDQVQADPHDTSSQLSPAQVTTKQEKKGQILRCQPSMAWIS